MHISKNDITLILDELEANRPFEACGVLVGGEEEDVVTVQSVVSIKNSKRTERSFELDPTEFYKVWNIAEKEGFDIVGVYHTHPLSSAKPSDWDKKTMLDASGIWVIAGIDGVFAYRMVGEIVESVEIVETMQGF